MISPTKSSPRCVRASAATTRRRPDMPKTAKPVVVLFDVDETLVHTGGSGARSWDAAFQKLYGIPATSESTARRARPIRRSLEQRSKASSVGTQPSTSSPSSMRSTCCTWAEDIFGLRAVPRPPRSRTDLGASGRGRRDARFGLGAMEGAARTKLIPANLNRFFLFGAYGSDSPDRAELTRLAIEKATLLHDKLTPAEVYVVGDTPHDMEATKSAGAVSGRRGERSLLSR